WPVPTGGEEPGRTHQGKLSQLPRNDFQPHDRSDLRDSSQLQAARIVGVRSKAEVVALPEQPVAPLALDNAARQIRRQRSLTRSGLLAEGEPLPRPNGCQLLTRETEVDLNRPPAVLRQFLQQRLLGGGGRPEPRLRLVRREVQEPAISLHLPLQRQQRRVPVPVAQL